MDKKLFEYIISLKRGEKFRSGKFLNIKDFFKPSYAIDNKEFNELAHFFSVDHLFPKLSSDPFNKETFLEIKEWIRLVSKMQVMGWDRSLKLLRNRKYIRFLKSYHKLLLKAKPLATQWANTQEEIEIKRWIEADTFQRKFAVLEGLPTVPFTTDEVPAGSILLTNVNKLFTGLRLKGKAFTLSHFIAKCKSYLSKICTGHKHIHAELALGDGEFFHLDSKKDGFYNCVVKKMKKPKVCFMYDILIPNEKLMLDTYNKSQPNAPIVSFKVFIDKIVAEAITRGVKVKSKTSDIMKLSSPFRRTKKYDPTKSWDPENKGYACSAVISSLFGRYGIDIGKSINKKSESLAPGDFLVSEYFSH